MPIEAILFSMIMEKKISMTKVVFFDTDCISSFLWTKTENLLVHCFGSDMIIPRQVYNEISKVPHLLSKVDVMISNGNLTVEDIFVNSEEYELYLKLTTYNSSSLMPLIGKGEAAAIALSKKNSAILASNNLRDVKYFVELYGLKHFATHDIMHKVVSDGIISIGQADSIWIQMVAKRRKLPYPTFTDYLNNL